MGKKSSGSKKSLKQAAEESDNEEPNFMERQRIKKEKERKQLLKSGMNPIRKLELGMLAEDISGILIKRADESDNSQISRDRKKDKSKRTGSDSRSSKQSHSIAEVAFEL